MKLRKKPKNDVSERLRAWIFKGVALGGERFPFASGLQNGPNDSLKLLYSTM